MNELKGKRKGKFEIFHFIYRPKYAISLLWDVDIVNFNAVAHFIVGVSQFPSFFAFYDFYMLTAIGGYIILIEFISLCHSTNDIFRMTGQEEIKEESEQLSSSHKKRKFGVKIQTLRLRIQKLNFCMKCLMFFIHFQWYLFFLLFVPLDIFYIQIFSRISIRDVSRVSITFFSYFHFFYKFLRLYVIIVATWRMRKNLTSWKSGKFYSFPFNHEFVGNFPTFDFFPSSNDKKIISTAKPRHLTSFLFIFSV